MAGNGLGEALYFENTVSYTLAGPIRVTKGTSMRITTLLLAMLTLVLVLTPSVRAEATADEDYARRLVIFNCSRCHAADQYYLAERSLKAWHLTIKRMQEYYYGDEAFSDEEADVMAKYLAAHPYNEADYKPRLRPAPSTRPVTVVATQPASAPVRMAVARRPAPRSPAKATALAKTMGYVAVVALVVMVVTGLLRKKMWPVFKKTHGVLAFVFCGSLTVHAAVFLAEYGAPAVLWLWFGIIATIILLSSEFTGLLKLQNRKLFVKAHIVAGVTGLILTILHWVWIYV